MNKTAFITMDFESLYDAECISNKNLERNESYSCHDGLLIYLDMLKKYNIKATIFVLASSINDITLPYLKRAIDEGHEIALHGYTHKSPLSMSLSEFERNIVLAKEFIKDKLNIEVKGYRAPCFGITNDMIDILRKNDFIYDASNLNFRRAINSGLIDLDNYEQKCDLVFQRDNFFEFNPSGEKMLGYNNLPISGGGYIRLIPWFIIGHHIKKHLKKHDSYMLYIHPFELISKKLPKIGKVGKRNRMYLTVHRRICKTRINKVFKLLNKYGYKYSKMIDYTKK